MGDFPPLGLAFSPWVPIPPPGGAQVKNGTQGVPSEHSCREAIVISGAGQTQFEMKAERTCLRPGSV